MRKFAPLVVGLFAIALTAANAHTAAAAPQKENTKKSSPYQTVYTVKFGDTLTSIGEKYKIKYTRLFDANKQIANADVIDVGDKVKIPTKKAKFAKRTATTALATAYSAGTVTYANTQSTKPVRVSTASGNVWDKIAQCESGGNWKISTGNGYSGGLQFASGTWGNYKGYASAAAAPKSVQIERAEQVRASRGGSYSAWPACSSKLGLR